MTDKNIEKFQEEINNTCFEEVSNKTDVNEVTDTFFDKIFQQFAKNKEYDFF